MEKQPILDPKGRRSRAELRPEGCAGAFRAERSFVGSEVALRCDEDGEEGRLVEQTHPEMQSRSAGVKRVTRRGSTSSRRDTTRAVPPTLRTFRGSRA